jgi:hypothetical protein
MSSNERATVHQFKRVKLTSQKISFLFRFIYFKFFIMLSHACFNPLYFQYPYESIPLGAESLYLTVAASIK